MILNINNSHLENDLIVKFFLHTTILKQHFFLLKTVDFSIKKSFVFKFTLESFDDSMFQIEKKDGSYVGY